MNGDAKTRRRRVLAAASAAVLGMTAVVFNRIVFAGEWLSGRDTFRVYLPLAKYWAQRVGQGELPEWYPYDALGQPFVGMMLSAAFHPGKLLYLVLPLQHALSVNTLVCYPLAAAGTFALARLFGVNRPGSLFAAVTFAFSGYLVGISNSLSYLQAMATMPWVLWAAERLFRAPTVGRAALTAALLALVCFTGETQSFTLSCGAVLLHALVAPSNRPWPRRLALAAGVIVAGVLMAAPQILPAMDALPAREGRNPLEHAQRFSLHPIRLFELAFGPVFISENLGHIAEELGAIVDPGMKSTWVDSVAVGVTTLALAALAAFSARKARMGRALAALAALVVLLMLGRHTPLYGVFYRFVPLWAVFRYPEKLVPWFGFIAALGAGYAVGRAHEDDPFRARTLKVLLVAAGLSVVCAVSAAGGLWSSLLDGIGVARLTHEPLTRWFILNASAAAVAAGVMALAMWRLRASLRGPLLVAAQGGLLTWYGMPLPQTVDLPILEQPIGFVETLVNRGLGTLGGPRVHAGGRKFSVPHTPQLSARELVTLSEVVGLEPDVPALFGIESTNHYLPATSPQFMSTLRDRRVSAQWVMKFAPLYGAEYFVADAVSRDMIVKSGAFELVDENPAWDRLLFRALQHQPRAAVVWPRCSDSQTNAIGTVLGPDFDPQREAMVECGRMDGPRSSMPPAGAARVTSYEPERIAVEVDAAQGALLVLNDALYSGWSASIDGSPAHIQAANVAVRGVILPGGKREVVFSYRQPGLRVGLLASAATAIAFMTLNLILARRLRR